MPLVYYTRANVIKLFTAVSYEFSKKAREFAPVKLFQPSLIICGQDQEPTLE
jgi:hypothetical protein